MLNISNNSIKDRFPNENFISFGETNLPAANKMFSRWLIILFIFFLIILALPWRQNIQARGNVTTLRPDQRPQTIHSTIAGRVEHWFVREGQFVAAGDTIVHLSEIKTDYFDPELVDRASKQVKAKEGSIESYQAKVKALENQLTALKAEQKFKQKQLGNKVNQSKMKLSTVEAAFEQAKIDYDIAIYQYNRIDTLYRNGIKSLTDLENKRLKMQETKAKLTKAENEVGEAENALIIAEVEFSNLENMYAAKIAKTESTKFSTISDMYDAEGSVNKLRTQYESYRKRSDFYFIVAPQDCYVNKAIVPGIGETVKEGEAVVNIMPAHVDLAVELFITPMDLPLIEAGEEVRFIFDGWPAFVFSGWPDVSFGTYSGTVSAIESNISQNGKYRILVSENSSKPWPEALRVGSGAKGIALLNKVPVVYELWRQLNGFPPDFYSREEQKMQKKEGDEFKAPVKSLK
jgi:multidrug resistance efflux pump